MNEPFGVSRPQPKLLREVRGITVTVTDGTEADRKRGADLIARFRRMRGLPIEVDA